MKKLLLVLIGTLTLSACSSQKDEATVYFTNQITPEGFMKIYQTISDNLEGKVGVKVHFGEEGNTYYVKPELFKNIVLDCKGTFIETNVLYKSPRQQTSSHIALAKSHGFTYAPIDILDAQGELAIENVDNCQHYKKFFVGKNLDSYNSFLIISHFKGHGSSGFGGAIKNISMGFATPKGKLAMHRNNFPVCDKKRCINCDSCAIQCPVNAIKTNPFTLDVEKCIGCGKCIEVCPNDALRYPREKEDMQTIFCERLVEYAKAIHDRYKKMVYINVLVDISTSCDCSRNPGKPFVPNIGILASTDIVAIEKASHDLVAKAHHCADPFLAASNASGLRQIEYAYSLGLGQKNYRLINIDTNETTTVKTKL